MTNALVNRIRQRIEARRDFMRTVFSKHHALVWRMTDAPSLRLLGMKLKPLEPSRARAVQPREVKVQPRNARAFEIPDLASQSPTERSFEVAEPTPKTMVADSSFVASELTAESSPELEDSEQIEPTVQAPTKLETGRAQEMIERLESTTPDLQLGVAPAVRSGETIPPDVSPRASTQNIVAESVITPSAQSAEVLSSPAFNPEEARVVEQNEIVAELSKSIETQTVQNTNNLTIEPQLTTSEKIDNARSNQSKPLTPARASEILRQRADQAAQPPNSSISQVPNEMQKVMAESQNQYQPTILRETANQASAALESNVRLENQIEPDLEPAAVARDGIEIPQVSAEMITPAEVQTSSFEPASERSTPQSTPQSTPKIETREAEVGETRDSRIQNSDVTAREITSEFIQTETRAVVQPAQKTVAREIPEELVTPETPSEFDARETQQEPVTRAVPQESIASDARTEPQTTSGSAQPLTSEQTDWQRSTPGDPQSGVVEIIRAKPPQNLRSKRLQKPTEAREETAKSQTPEARVSQEALNPPTQNLAGRMKSLQQRFGANEQTRFDPSDNVFSQRVEVDATEQMPAPQFQSISDVAQRLARRYSQTPSTTLSEQENSSLDLKVGQQLGQTQTRAANEFVQQGTQPVQLRESTRTFLAPLIGFDPSLARVFVGPQATELTSNLNADGATVGTDVYLNNGFDEQTPEGMGLLAHELTHVGQNLKPDFVPPMLQSTPGQQDFSNESFETQARLVEARVTNTASIFIPGIALEAGTRQTSTASAASSNNLAQNTDAWNGLPAPWEAMPNFNSNATDFVTVVSPNAPDSGATTNTGLAPMSDSPSALVQLADADRPSENRDNAPPGAAGGQPPPPPGQDVDILAQQVYEILKRRLSSERRREG